VTYNVKRLLLAATLLFATSVFVQACGSDDNGGEDATASVTTNAASSPGAGTDGTTAAGSPSPAGTQAPQATLSPEEATAQANDVTGGGPDTPPQVISTIPAVSPIAGTTPVVDPTEIAKAAPDSSALELAIDMNASEPGIQSARDVNPGDTFKVAIVAMNVPPNQGNTGGIAAFNFILHYDRTKLIAPTIVGGPATERNPDLNIDDLGGAAAGWDCLPAPEGDMDDPGGIDGDGDPATGQALLSCFTVGGKESGTVTLATVTFTAIASGASNMTLSDFEIGDILGIGLAHCAGDVQEPFVPCREGAVNVR
jgi:hypothetical protein